LFGRWSIIWATPHPFFALVIFQVGSHVFVQDLPQITILLLKHLSCNRDHKHLLIEMDLTNYFPWWASNQDPPDLYLLSSWHDRSEPPCPAQILLSNTNNKRSSSHDLL
jgi:hypothetical protein